MISAFRLGNFKAFGPTQRIPLKPLTLVFGPNSAGKSSIIHSLALAHEARRSGNLDAFRTDIGGTSIDLGGFRQYVFRRDAARRVEWAAEIDLANLSGRLAELLAPVDTATVAITFGLPLDDLGAPVAGKVPSLATYEVLGNGETLLRMSQRRDGRLKLDRLASEHPVFREVLAAIVASTTTSEIKDEDRAALDQTIADLIPQLTIKAGRFLPQGIEGSAGAPESGAPESMLFPVGRGSRSEDLAGAVRLYLPRILNEIVRGLDNVVGEQIDRLQYLGPLRSYPPRHLAFSEHDDANWRAGGGYAWDVLRRDQTVRDRVNAWLCGDWLQTHYEILVRDLVPMARLEQPMVTMIELTLQRIQDEGIDLEPDYDDDSGEAMGAYPVIRDPEGEARRIVEQIAASNTDSIPELVLVDRRTDTLVSHRDVGIGISQVLPVLVSCVGLRDRIVAIEQPEIHLHPALQAELGDVFIESALGANRNLFILETHSEHLLLRIMRRMRETFEAKNTDRPPLRPEDVSLLYVEPEQRGSLVREMALNERVDLVKAWPGGFFEEGLREVFSDD